MTAPSCADDCRLTWDGADRDGRGRQLQVKLLIGQSVGRLSQCIGCEDQLSERSKFKSCASFDRQTERTAAHAAPLPDSNKGATLSPWTIRFNKNWTTR